MYIGKLRGKISFISPLALTLFNINYEYRDVYYFCFLLYLFFVLQAYEEPKKLKALFKKKERKLKKFSADGLEQVEFFLMNLKTIGDLKDI